jgi:hypothetical protein
MLNLIITSSPRLAAWSANKELGEDVVLRPASWHRMQWALGRDRKESPTPVIEQSLREQTA